MTYYKETNISGLSEQERAELDLDEARFRAYCEATSTSTRAVTEDSKKAAAGMSDERFRALVEEIRGKSLDTLLKKNANYGNEDRLHNFRLGASIIGGTPAQAALGYMAKHLASLIDKVKKDDFSDRDDLLEKCQDIINYVVFIWCAGNE